MAGFSSTPWLSQNDRRIIASWPASEATVCSRCGNPARTSLDHAHPQWACLDCEVVVYSMMPAFCRASEYKTRAA